MSIPCDFLADRSKDVRLEEGSELNDEIILYDVLTEVALEMDLHGLLRNLQAT